jgi:putative hemolysin
LEESPLSGYIERLLLDNRLNVEAAEYDLKHLPAEPPYFILVNEQFDSFDELILIRQLTKVTDQFKILTARSQYVDHPLLKPYFHSAFSTQFQGFRLPLSAHAIYEAMKAVISEGKSCVIFMDYSFRRYDVLRRLQQNRRIIRQVKRFGIPVVPVHLHADGVRPQGATLTLRIGTPITVKDQQSFRRYRRFGKYVQSRIMALGSPLEVKSFYRKAPIEHQEPIAEALPDELIRKEIRELTFANLIVSRANFDVFVAEARQIPNTLKEIGRLREITFREVGEGSGKSRDLDEYDLYYHQLIIWDREKGKIAGGYRLGKGDEIFNRFGVEGFYIYSLFKIKPGFFPIMKKSVELGRSYVTKEYQRHRLPLFLLWKGILHFLLQNPRYEYLYGPLSISKYYSEISKSMIIAFVRKFYFDHQLARHLEPRQPFRAKVPQVDVNVIMENLGDKISNLDNFIEDIEPAHFRMPVLLKQYVRQNAKFISFNVDPNFSDVLDGFMILNLKDLPYSTIQALKEEQEP